MEYPIKDEEKLAFCCRMCYIDNRKRESQRSGLPSQITT